VVIILDRAAIPLISSTGVSCFRWIGRGRMVAKCHEFFECQKLDCIMFEEEEARNCWDVEPALTLCTNCLTRFVKTIADKMAYCEGCIYYNYVFTVRKNEGLPL